MCGIWGFKGKPNKDILKSIIQLADERGGHSYGFASINKKGNLFIYKSNGRVEIDKVMFMLEGCVIAVGQSRLATSGTRQLSDCQPFIIDNFAFVHNGNISNHMRINELSKHNSRYNTDSEALIGIIKKDVDISLLKDPFAYIYIDIESMAIGFLNDKINLFISNVENTNYICSKRWQEKL